MSGGTSRFLWAAGAAAVVFSCGSPSRDLSGGSDGAGAGSGGADAGSSATNAGSSHAGSSGSKSGSSNASGASGSGDEGHEAGAGGDAGEPGTGPACDVTCEASNAHATCVSGTCVIASCSEGYFDCDGDYSTGCEVKNPAIAAAPVASYPTRGAYTGSVFAPSSFKVLRPTLRWSTVAATSCGALSYELEMDDSCQPGGLGTCAFPSPEVHEQALTSPTFTPATNLPVSKTAPVGAFYAWRVRACDASARCSDWSPASYLNVGRLKEDLNGDGYGDVVLGDQIYLGSPQFDATSDGALASTPSSNFGAAFLGDVNGDGFGDLGATVYYAPSSGVAPIVFFGADTIGAMQNVVISKGSGGPSAYIYTTGADDLNGDGFADVSVTWDYQMPVAQVRVFYGAQTLPANPSLVIDSKVSGTFPFGRAAGVGDLDGDGYADLMVPTGWTSTSSDPLNEVVELYRGGPNPDNQVDVSIPQPDTACMISAEVWPAGDLNQDGFGDAVATCSGSRVSLYSGGQTPSNAFALVLKDTSYYSAAAGWDFDGDQVPDFMVARKSTPALAFLGNLSIFISASGVATQLNADQLSVSDDDGDGRPDVTSLYSGSGYWAGSDGTINPKPLFIGEKFDTLAR